MLTVTEAQEEILKCVRSFGTEMIAIQQALGRTLAEDLSADRDYPPFNRAAMDGYALKVESDELKIENGKFEVIETILAGNVPSKTLDAGQCYKIMTGAAVPLCANTIVRVEDSIQESNYVRFTIESIKSFQNIARRGEDLQKEDIILKAGQLCTPAVISALAVTGKSSVNVWKLPTVALISTGDEIKPIDFTVSDVQIRDSNSYALEAFLQHYKIPVLLRELVTDNPDALKSVLSKAIMNDITIISGGVSAGDADFIPAVLASIGVKKVFHKVQLKPGKPLWFGITEKGHVVFALPGNPMSAQVAFKIFIEPYLRKCFGLPEQLKLYLPMLTERRKKVKFDEYFPAVIKNKTRSGLLPQKFNGSGDVTSTLHSDGLVLQPAFKEILAVDDIAVFIPWHIL